LSRQFVAENQRERLLAALAECLHERGYEKTTVAAIGKRAAVSKSDFYKHFESKEACFFAAYDDAVERVRDCLRASCERRGPWEARVLDALEALLDLLATDPGLSRLLLVEGLRAGRGVYDRYQDALQSFVPYLREGAPSPPDGAPLPAETDEALVGGVASLLARRALVGELERLPEFLPQIGEFVLTPYLGVAEARRIISER